MYSRAFALAAEPTGREPIVPASMLTWARALASTKRPAGREHPAAAASPSRSQARDNIAEAYTRTRRLRPLRQRQPSGIERHADHGVDAHRVQLVNFLHRGDAPGRDDLARRCRTDGADRRHVRALKQTLAIDVGVEEAAEVRLESP